MSMTRNEVLRELCSIVGMVYQSIGEFDQPSDGFCAECTQFSSNFQHSGITIEYVRNAVVNQLNIDGYTIHPNWDRNGNKLR